ncbi:benenodin family lasso peptide [Sphingopyxis sp. DHUNG17]|nr:benenodin family lasso peptide [Sphingopyxis lutea]MBL0770017.1 benenodin family lasso peptide [Sphingopyxis lutea]
MDRETNELIELGSVSADTAGDFGIGTEANGKVKLPGLSID